MIITLKPSARAIIYLRKYAFENARTYAFLFLAVAAFLVLWLGVYLNFANPFLFSEKAQVAYYFVTLFLAGCLSAGMLFADLGAKPKAIHYLLVPASTLEKFITTLLFGVLLFFVMASAIFYAIDALAVTIANIKFHRQFEVINLFTLNRYENPFFEGDITDIFYFYFPIQATFLLCSIYFKKHGLFKAIVAMGLLWVVFIAMFLGLQQLLPVGRFDKSFALYEVVDASGDNKLVALPLLLVYCTKVFAKYLLTPLLWTASYFRLREKQL